MTGSHRTYNCASVPALANITLAIPSMKLLRKAQCLTAAVEPCPTFDR